MPRPDGVLRVLTKSNKPVVAHAASSYYPLTANWIHTQIQNHTRYAPLVLTQRTENLDLENTPEYYALLERPMLESLINRASHKVLGYYPSFLYMLRRKKARLIHAHFGTQAYAIMPLAKAAGLPLITMFYGYDASRLPQQQPEWHTRYPELFKYGSRFLVEGSHMGQQLIKLGCPPEKITVQHLGIELDKYLSAPRRYAVGETLKILVAGRFTEKKGIVHAIKAYAELVRREMNVSLTVIGDAGKDEEGQQTKREIMDVIASNGLSERIAMLGLRPLEELRRAYYDHHIFLSPSVQAADGDNEGGAPVTLIEAAATGMPAVATHHCDIPEVVRDGIGGLLAPERDTDALVRHLTAFIENPQLVNEMGVGARHHVEAEYDARRQADKLEQIYDHLLAEQKM
jgi:colanic acid/amylovoran biosynthesis glycosyltransferase